MPVYALSAIRTDIVFVSRFDGSIMVRLPFITAGETQRIADFIGIFGQEIP